MLLQQKEEAGKTTHRHLGDEFAFMCPKTPDIHETNYPTVEELGYTIFTAPLDNRFAFEIDLSVDDSDNPLPVLENIDVQAVRPNLASRANRNVLAPVKFADKIVSIVLDIAKSICDSIPEQICALACATNPAKATCHTALAAGKVLRKALSLMISPAEFNNKIINSAELNSALKNTGLLLEASCGTENLLQDESDEIDADLDKGFCAVVDSNDRDTSEYNHISTCNLYHEVLCRPVPQLLPGHGCDGVDNDCDEYTPERDECDEDAYPPTIDFSKALEYCGDDKHIFGTLAEAQMCVETHVITADDCHTVQTIVAPVNTAGPSICGQHWSTATTTVEDECGKTTTGTMRVLVDTNIPAGQPVCEFSNGANAAPAVDISEAVALCGGNKFFKTVGDAIACIEANSGATDDCRSLDIAVVQASSTDTACGAGGSTTIREISITATVAGCSLSTTETMVVYVDPNIPATTCDFSFGPDVNPVIDTDLTVKECEGVIFPTIAGAEACVMKHTVATDGSGGCRPTVDSVATVQEGTSCVHTVTFTAELMGCAPLVSSKTISVVIDNSPPVPTCNYGVGQFIQETGPGVLVDTQLTYGVTENCAAEGDINVVIQTFSNEFEIVKDQPMAVQYTGIATGEVNTSVGVWVAAATCSTVNNGQCIADGGSRTYMTRITATDQAGLSQSVECSVPIIPNGNGGGAPPSKFFLIDTYTDATYTPTVA